MTTFAPRILRASRPFSFSSFTSASNASHPSPTLARSLPHPRRPLATPTSICIGLVSAAGLTTYQRSALFSTVKCDAPRGAVPFGSERKGAVKSGVGSRLDAKALREVSSGSLLGLGAGVLVAFFSKPLALLIGLTIAGVQFLEYNGIHLVPYGYLQRYAKSIDLQRVVASNVAFKLAFGVTFALAGFGSFGA